MWLRMIDKIAEMLDELQYPTEPSREIIELAKANNIVIVFGSSDDLMEFRGAIDDEAGAWNGATALVNKDGLFDEHDCHCKYTLQAKEQCSKIHAIWDDKDRNCSWSYKTDIPHTEFKLMEDDEVYCYGIVFSLDNLA
jgi:hypothetical protein